MPNTGLFRILFLQVLEIEFDVFQLTRHLLHVHFHLALLVAQHTQLEGEFIALLCQSFNLLTLLLLQRLSRDLVSVEVPGMHEYMTYLELRLIVLRELLTLAGVLPQLRELVLHVIQLLHLGEDVVWGHN